MASAAPLVSCIMPTRNRRVFVSQGIRYFQRQDYDDRELVVVDDGEDRVEDLIPADARIRYIRVERRCSIGAKRNLACEAARGQLVAHWDDDDWSSPARLSAQVAALEHHGADACGLSELYYYQLAAGQAWLYRYPREGGAWVAGGTLLYRREAWRAHPFDDVDVGEDTRFVRQLDGAVHVLDERSLYVGLIHERNTAGKNLTSRRWERRPLGEVTAMLAADRDFYAALRNHTTQTAVPRRPICPDLTVVAPFLVYDGYGSMAEYQVLGMQRAGARVCVAPLEVDRNGLSSELLERLRAPPQSYVDPVLFFSWVRDELRRLARVRNLFINTMWEGSRLPPGWTEALNRARAVIVPTRFVAKVCRDSGVEVPVEVVPQGVDPAIYHFHDRAARPSMTTLIVGTVIGRKHVREGIEAWKRAFSGDPRARLLIKSRFHYGNFEPDDPRIRFVDANETGRGIPHWYRQADVLLALGNEGFGLPMIEGMASGLPVIALASEGQGDVCEDAPGCVLPVGPVRFEPCDDSPFGPGGVRGVPDVDEVAERLRWVAQHPHEARALGHAASNWVQEHRNVWAMGPATLAVIERYLEPARALRRHPRMVAPSLGTPCGIAEYATRLAAELPGATLTAQAPDLSRTRLLHVQHEFGICSDAEMSALLRRAREAHLPVLVTEHTVEERARPWEGEADVLVSLTEGGARTLRQRWPQTRVEWLRHGCPTFFPLRKRRRGRVIGAFGFLAPHKGFWRLLEVLRALPHTELLLLAHARAAQMEAAFETAAAGLPVRRVGAFLAADEVARRLAAEADVLVFWYDETKHWIASGAVRVGLATGVPVLASPTRWFADLRDVTHQPRDLVEGVRRLLEDSALRRSLTRAAAEFCRQHSWTRSAERHRALWASVERQ